MTEDKKVLVDLLGYEKGTSLYAKAVRMSAKTGIDIADVCQEMAIAAQKTIEKLGEYVESYAVTVARNSMMNSVGYGVSWYYNQQGFSEEYIENSGRTSDDGGDEIIIRHQPGEIGIEINLSEQYEEAMLKLTEEQRIVSEALVGGWKAQEIAQAYQWSNAKVSRIKAQLQGIFGYAVSR